jgi:hypothetical protein
MAAGYFTQSEYTLQQVVVLFGELLSPLAEAGVTGTDWDIFHFWTLENNGYLVLRYLNTGEPPFKEWAQEWLHHREVESSYTNVTDFGQHLIWYALV